MEANELFKKMLTEYDKGEVSNSTFYDHLPYVRDHDLAVWKPGNMVSGNVYKNTQYKLVSPVIIQNDFNFVPETFAIRDDSDGDEEDENLSDDEEYDSFSDEEETVADDTEMMDDDMPDSPDGGMLYDEK